MALKLTLPTTFSAPEGLAVRRADPVLPAAGALLLLEPARTNPGTTMPSGTVENLAADQASTLLATAAAELRAGAGTKGTPPAGKFSMSRTTRGALAGIVTQTMSPFPTGTGYALDFPAAVKSYIYANPGHKFYYSLWGTITRAGSQPGSLLSVGSADANYHAYFYGGNANPATDRYGKPGLSMMGAPGTPHLISVAPSAMTGTPSASTAIAAVKWGNYGAPGATVWQPHSWVFYRAYLEDLTVSGRTVAGVQGLETAEFDTAFGAGGRYAGDTWTDPATIA